MTDTEILDIVLREMTAIGAGWRLDWNGFDGRTLRNQLDAIADWASKAHKNPMPSNYLGGSEFYSEQSQ